MFRVEKSKLALQPALNKVNVKDAVNLKPEVKQLAVIQDSLVGANFHDQNQQFNSLKQLVTDKLGNVISARQPLQPTNQHSENYDSLKPAAPKDDQNAKARKLELSPKEPSPPRFRQHTRTTRNSQKLLLQQQQPAETKQPTTTEITDHYNLRDVQKSGTVTEPENAPEDPQPSVLSSALQALSRIPRLSTRAPSQTNIIQPFKPRIVAIQEKTAKTLESGEKSMQLEEHEEQIEDIDKSTSRDALFLACDYVKDIYVYLRELENVQCIGENYLKDQKILTPKVRQRLINWCIDIHLQLRLLPETLYLTISTIDRFFQIYSVTQENHVQLVALGATLISSKYEEIYPPEIGDLVHLSQNTYTRREIIKAEMHILKQLNFNLGRPVPLAFLRRFSRAAQFDMKSHSIAKYLMELSLTEYECTHWRPSLLAATALYITVQITNKNRSSTTTGSGAKINSAGKTSSDGWSKTLAHYTMLEKRELLAPAATLCKILKRAQKSPASFMCVKKYISNLSAWTELKSPKIEQIIKAGEKL